jgi:beta,beta-carotene 9',10'-dioxygenase
MATADSTASRQAPGYELAFTSLDAETRLDSLPVDGALPPWLTGTLLRTGPARFEVGERTVRHVFDGLAMLHSFSVDGERQRVGYANRFLRTRAYRAAEDGRIGYGEFATDPCRSIFRRITSMFSPGFTDNANVNLARLGDQFVAYTETPMPVEFDPKTLETLGIAYSPPGRGPKLITAHPHHDPKRREMLTYQVHLGPRSSYRFWASKDGRTHREIARIGVREPSYIHSFGMTERYLVLFRQPLVVNPMSLPLSSRPFIENYRWEPERGTQIAVVDRETGAVRDFETEALFHFHHINSFEHDGELVVDLAGFADTEVIDAFYIDRIRGGNLDIPSAELRRYRIPLSRGSEVRRETLVEESIELPRINYRRNNGRPYRYAYGFGNGPAGMQLVKADVERREATTWREDGRYPGEPVFVAAPDAREEDEGVVLSPVLDSRKGNSFLLVLDGQTFEERARAEVPHHLPFALHGSFFSGVSP